MLGARPKPIIGPGATRDCVREFLERRLEDLIEMQHGTKDKDLYQRAEGAIDEILGLWMPLIGERSGR